MDDETKKYWIWLSRIEGIGAIRKNKLLKLYKHPQTIWNLKKEELEEIEGIKDKLADRILDETYRKNLDLYLNYMKKNQIDLITIQDIDYPIKLKEIYDPPTVLFYKGNRELFNYFSIGIVGCRECSKYGELVADKISSELANKKVAIISGLARGIDTISHIGTLKGEGKTIAVIGNGLDNIYPYENKKLANEIIEKGGLIISEYVIGTKPNRNNFPARNRIISGMSNGIVVVEARKKSGTQITVDFALEQGRNVYVVPGNITSLNSEGTNELIKEGAKVVTKIEDILEDYF